MANHVFEDDGFFGIDFKTPEGTVTIVLDLFRCHTQICDLQKRMKENPEVLPYLDELVKIISSWGNIPTPSQKLALDIADAIDKRVTELTKKSDPAQ